MVKVTVSISAELDLAVRKQCLKKGDMSELYEQALRSFLKERGVKV